MNIAERKVIAILIAVVAAAVTAYVVFSMTQQSMLEKMKKAFDDEEFELVLELADESRDEKSLNAEVVVHAAKAAERLGLLEKAIIYLDDLPYVIDGSVPLEGWKLKADLLQRLGRLTPAVDALRVIVDQTSDAVVRRELATLLAGCGYRFAAIQQLNILAQDNEANRDDLILLGLGGRSLFLRGQLERFRSLDTTDEMSSHGLLVHAREHRDAATVNRILAETPQLLLQRARNALRVEGDAKEAARYLSQINAEQDEGALGNPALLILCGQIAKTFDRSDLALKCFDAALNDDPWNHECLHAVADLTRQSDLQRFEQCQAVIGLLTKIEAAARQLRNVPSANNAEDMKALVNALTELGRHDEARGWARIALAENASIEWARGLLLQPESTKQPSPGQHSAPEFDISELYPWLRTVGDDAAPAPESTLRFSNVAEEVGLVFEYDNGRGPTQQGLFMHQWTGGGVGVIDFDRDEWPDLVFTQGGALENSMIANARDVLCRNVLGQAFDNVSSDAFKFDEGFGQGVAVGDINNDGFADIYVGRVGENVLLVNQGDGTFVASDNLPASDAWTTSTAIADINRDSQPDIYDVNYLTGDRVYQQRCDNTGVTRICGPTDFPAAADRVLLSSGDGRFRDASEIVFAEISPQRGMGLIIADLLRTGVNSVYVANDEAANQLLSFNDSENGFTDAALPMGVAFDRFGSAQGSMGLAVGSQASGDLQLFVTNYYSEANNLYRQVGANGFVDAADEAGLAADGYAMLGFGCQFGDFDSDGQQEIVVANGHLDDFRHLDHPFRMRPQIFQTETGQRFFNAAPRSSYFQKKLLGRALATLDWNQDGRIDFVVTHIADPVALVENRSQQLNGTLSVDVIGTSASRDSVGTVLTIASAELTQRRWIAAGDGYQCSNSKVGHFALPNDAVTSRLEVNWPDGQSRSFDVESGANVRIIQGRKQVYSLPK